MVATSEEALRIVDGDAVAGDKGSLDGEADGHLLVARAGNAVGIGDDEGNVGHLTPDAA